MKLALIALLLASVSHATPITITGSGTFFQDTLSAINSRTPKISTFIVTIYAPDSREFNRC